MHRPIDTRHVRRRAAMTALLLALVAGLLTACNSDVPPRAPLKVGAVVKARSEIRTTGAKGRVLLPLGSLYVRSGKPVGVLSAEQTADHTPLAAPGGGSFVPLQMVARAGVFSGLREIFGPPLKLDISLVADGERYPVIAPRVDIPGEQTSDVYVAVPGTPDDLQLDIDYAGVTQTFDLKTGSTERRRAELLSYTLDYSLKQKPCPSARWLYVDDNMLPVFACQYSEPVITPFLNGKFARRGHAFAVVKLNSSMAQVLVVTSGGRGRFQVRKNNDDMSLDGAKPIAELAEEQAQGFSAGYYAWRIDVDKNGKPRMPRTLHFRQKYQLDLHSLTGDLELPERRLLTIEGDIPL